MIGDRGARVPEDALGGIPAVADRFVAGGRQLVLEVRARGRGAGAAFALVAEGIEIELRPRDLEWLAAIAPRALQRARREAV